MARKIFFLLCVLVSAAGRSYAADGFMGHYGYLLTVPEGYSTKASFKEEAEVVLFFPKACEDLSFSECGKIGLLELTVLPKRWVKKDGITSFKQYIDAVVQGVLKAKAAPVVTRGKIAGLPSAKIYMRVPSQSLNAMFMLEGSKVYYRVKFREKVSEKLAAGLLSSLSEVAPSDTPPQEH